MDNLQVTIMLQSSPAPISQVEHILKNKNKAYHKPEIFVNDNVMAILADIL